MKSKDIQKLIDQGVTTFGVAYRMAGWAKPLHFTDEPPMTRTDYSF